MFCRRFIDAQAQRLLSGGNDRKLHLWQAGDGNRSRPISGSYNAEGTIASWQHMRKVNAIALHGEQMFVADTSRHISIYNLGQTPMA